MLHSRSILKRCFSSLPVTPRVTQLFIDGKFVDSASGKKFETINPHNEEVITSVHEAGAEDVDRAVAAARKAFDHGPWRKMSGLDRANLLFRFAELLEQNKDELALLEALDNGKPATIANMVDMNFTINVLKYYGGWADKIHGDTIPLHGDFFGYVRKEPVGVCGQIIPWNFPLAMMSWKLGPALATGCTVVMKTAEQTPLSALRAAELIKEAGFPDGVVNILSGFGETAGRHLVTHPDVDKIAFTGSSEVGMEIMSRSSLNGLRKVTLELGGKSPVIICEDADIEQAIAGAHAGVFFNTGQCCSAGTRLLVHEKVYDQFIERSVEEAKKIKVGGQFDETTTQGPVISKEQHDKVLGLIEAGKKEGANLLIGGNRYGDKGYHVEPTVFADVKDDMRIAREEIFGPVMSIFKYSDTEEAITRANDTEYGLASAVFTKDVNKAIHISNGIRAGQVYVNGYHLNSYNTPFGGYKNSGIGRETGKSSLENYLEQKTVIYSRPSGSLP